MKFSVPRMASLGTAIFCILVAVRALAGEPDNDFDAANKLYEEGKFTAAAAAYEKLAQSGVNSWTLHFNLGDAWFKAGQTGRAIAEWRLAERITPRDPNLHFNLQFARKRVLGAEAPAGPLWQRALDGLTLNEWTVLVSVLLWIWFSLLALREYKPSLRRALAGYTATAGVGALLMAACLGAAAAWKSTARPGVVIVPEAIARTGPLDEAKVLHQLRDGTELVVLDEKEVASTAGDKKQSWLQVRDAAHRTGWVKRSQVIELRARLRE